MRALVIYLNRTWFNITILFQFVTNERAKGVLSDAEHLTEDKLDELLDEFLHEHAEGLLESKGWDSYLSAYTLSKACLNAYTRIWAKKDVRLIVNAVCPGYVKTDINCFTGNLSAEEGAESPVRLAMLPTDGPSGFFFYRNDVSPF